MAVHAVWSEYLFLVSVGITGLLGQQNAYRAPIDTFQAGSTACLVTVESHSGIGATVEEVQRASPVNLLACLNTYTAENAFIGVVIKAWGRSIEGQFFFRHSQSPNTPAVDTELGHQFLELALATAGATTTGDMVVGDE